MNAVHNNPRPWALYRALTRLVRRRYYKLQPIVLTQRLGLTLVLMAVPSLWVVSTVLAKSNKPRAVTDDDEARAPLDNLVGFWSCVEHHFDDKGQEIAEVQADEQIDWILDGHVIRRIYSRSTGRKTYRAIGMLSWNSTVGRYDGTWFDNLPSTGPSVVVGRWDKAKHQFTFTLTIASSPDDVSRYTVVEVFLSDKKREATTYEHRGQDLVKRMKVVCQRIAPCPASTDIRTIGPEEEFAPHKQSKR